MKKGSKMKVCDCCGRRFVVQSDKQWKTLCPDCNVNYWVPLRKYFKLYQLNGHWKCVQAYFRLMKSIDMIIHNSDVDRTNQYDNGLKPYWTGSEYDYR